MQFARFAGRHATHHATHHAIGRQMVLGALAALLLVAAPPAPARAEANSSGTGELNRAEKGERAPLTTGRLKTRLSLAGSWMKVAYWGLRVRGAGATRATQTEYAVAVNRHLELLDHLATLTGGAEGQDAGAGSEPKRSRILARHARGFANKAETWLASLEGSAAATSNDREVATRMARRVACMVELQAFLGERDARLVCGEEGPEGEATAARASAPRSMPEQLAKRLSELAARTRQGEQETPAWEAGVRAELLRAAELVLGAEGSSDLRTSLADKRKTLLATHSAELGATLGQTRQGLVAGLVTFELLLSAPEAELGQVLKASGLQTDDAGRAAIVAKVVALRANGKLVDLRATYLKGLSAYGGNAEAYGGKGIATGAKASERATNVTKGAEFTLDTVISQLAQGFAVGNEHRAYRQAAVAALQTKGISAVVEGVGKALGPYEQRAAQDLRALSDPAVPLFWLDRAAAHGFGAGDRGAAFVTAFQVDTTQMLGGLGLDPQAYATSHTSQTP
ncbi:MAG: hypothetical protein IPG96_15190 [Proteobacteria bacterium]|nr:hypothetical protein [Pseudomonadota bacterium]